MAKSVGSLTDLEIMLGFVEGRISPDPHIDHADAEISYSW